MFDVVKFLPSVWLKKLDNISTSRVEIKEEKLKVLKYVYERTCCCAYLMHYCNTVHFQALVNKWYTVDASWALCHSVHI
jgi:hypothetical protein